MTLAVTNRVKLRTAKEVTYGTVAGATGRRTVRFTGESLNYGLQFDQSKEIRSDRMVSDQILLGASASGGVNFEAIYREYDDFYEQFLLSTFSSFAGSTGSVTAASATFTSSTLTQTGGTSFVAIPKGAWVNIQGCTSTFLPNNGVWQVSTSVSPTATVLTFQGTPFATAGAATGTVLVSHSRLINGTSLVTRDMEVEFNDLGKFLTLVGMAGNKMSLQAQQNAVLTGSFDFIGAGALALAAASNLPSTDSVTYPTTYDVLNSTSNVAQLYEGGVALAGTFAKSVSIDVDNSIRAQMAIANLMAVGCAAGTLKVTGKLSAYFASTALFDKFTGNVSSSITVVTKDSAGNGYAYTIPNVEFTGAQLTAGSLDQDIMVDLDFSAKLDPTTSAMILIDRYGVALT